ncbi:MAG: hypothetical protein KDB02_02845 [Acidimicrobiales bacterium]|nr:hypothetical protein [Acidimicrobiales bacterium]
MEFARAVSADAAIAVGAMAAERTLPVDEALVPLLPEGALVRGRSVACSGLLGPSLALAMAAAACRKGSWSAMVDVPWLGVEAAAEIGVPLERFVRVDSCRPDGSVGRDERGDLWGEVLGAVLDGFEIVITRVPPRVPAGLVRRITTRLRSRGGVLVVVGDPGPLSADVVCESGAVRWDGVGAGHGHLRARRVVVRSSGRRVARPRQVDLWLPAPGGGIVAAPPEPIAFSPRPEAASVLSPWGEAPSALSPVG